MKRSVVLLGLLFAGNVLADIDEGLIAYFPLDGSANDESDAHKESVEFGNINYTQGKVNEALKLAGDGGYVVSSAHMNSYPNLTISFWMYPEEDRDMTPYSAACGPDSDGGVSFAYSAEKEIMFSIGKAINCNTAAGRSTVKEEIEGAGQWYHVAGVYKASESLALYVNGKKVSEVNGVTFPIPQVYLSNFHYIGSHQEDPGGASNWKGDIDDLRVYNRVLSDAEIEELYMASVGNCDAPKAPEIADNLDMHIPLAVYDGPSGKVNLWVDLEFVGDVETGEMAWSLRDYGNVDECGDSLEVAQ